MTHYYLNWIDGNWEVVDSNGKVIDSHPIYEKALEIKMRLNNQN